MEMEKLNQRQKVNVWGLEEQRKDPAIKQRALIQKRHAIKRCKQRFGYRLFDAEYDMIIFLILKKHYYFLEKLSGRISAWCVDVGCADGVALFDHKTFAIRTFFTMEMWERHKDRQGRRDKRNEKN
jgi:hypothetical protein